MRQRRQQTDAQEFFGSAGELCNPTSHVCDTCMYLLEGELEPQGRGRSGSVRRERLQSDQEEPVVRRRPKKTRRTKLERQSTLIRTEVESLPTFWPVFIVFISVAQVCTCVCMYLCVCLYACTNQELC